MGWNFSLSEIWEGDHDSSKKFLTTEINKNQLQQFKVPQKNVDKKPSLIDN